MSKLSGRFLSLCVLLLALLALGVNGLDTGRDGVGRTLFPNVSKNGGGRQLRRRKNPPAPGPPPNDDKNNGPMGPPSISPTNSPTSAPTNSPSIAPSRSPTSSPTNAPTDSPTIAPTSSPTSAPTIAPTKSPTSAPTNSPTIAPTKSPTSAPTYSSFWCQHGNAMEVSADGYTVSQSGSSDNWQTATSCAPISSGTRTMVFTLDSDFAGVFSIGVSKQEASSTGYPYNSASLRINGESVLQKSVFTTVDGFPALEVGSSIKVEINADAKTITWTVGETTHTSSISFSGPYFFMVLNNGYSVKNVVSSVTASEYHPTICSFHDTQTVDAVTGTVVTTPRISVATGASGWQTAGSCDSFNSGIVNATFKIISETRNGLSGIGISTLDALPYPTGTYPGKLSVYRRMDGAMFQNNRFIDVGAASYNTQDSSDVITVELDATNGLVSFYLNEELQVADWPIPYSGPYYFVTLFNSISASGTGDVVQLLY